MRLKNRKSFFFIDFHSHRRAKGGKLHPFPIYADKQKACKRTVYRLLMVAGVGFEPHDLRVMRENRVILSYTSFFIFM